MLGTRDYCKGLRVMETTTDQANTTVRLLDAWKVVKGLDSDYKAAKELKVSLGTPSNWRHGRSHAKPALAARMARDLGMDELSVLAAIEADRAHDGDDRRTWQKHGRSAFMALLVGLSMGLPQAGRAGELHRLGSLQQMTGQNPPLCEIPHWRRRRRRYPTTMAA